MTLCNSELRSFEKHLEEFRTRRVRIAAISVDSNRESQTLCRDQGYTFLFLSDPKARSFVSMVSCMPALAKTAGTSRGPLSS